MCSDWLILLLFCMFVNRMLVDNFLSLKDSFDKVHMRILVVHVT